MDETATINFTISTNDVVWTGAAVLCLLVGIFLSKFLKKYKRTKSEMKVRLANRQAEERDTLQEMLGEFWWEIFRKFEDATKTLGADAALLHAKTIVGNLISRRQHNQNLVPPITMEQVVAMSKAFDYQSYKSLELLQRLLQIRLGE